MTIAMLGSDYSYGLMPVYAGRSGYVRSAQYLGAGDLPPDHLHLIPGAEVSTGAAAAAKDPTWQSRLWGMLEKGVDAGLEWLRNDSSRVDATQAERERNAQAEKNLLSGLNPFAGLTGSSATDNLVPIALVACIGLMVFMAMKRRRR